MSTSHLWNQHIDVETYGGKAAYQVAVLEQYRIYVEMADRISQRRAATNTFFLTLNTAILAAIAGIGQYLLEAPIGMLALPAMALAAQCLAWLALLHSYRQLNTAKYRVIGCLEERLPASPYWAAEWHELGEGKDRRRYWPLTHLERWIPVLFATMYVAVFAVAAA